MKSVIENYINGNLSDAKIGAGRYSWRALYIFMIDELGYTGEQARALADYLKGHSTKAP